VALSAIASQQAKPTQLTMERTRQLLDYCASQEDAVLTYNKSDMVLAVHSDAGYLNKKKQSGGAFLSVVKCYLPFFQQRSSINDCTNNKGSHVIRGRSRNGGVIHKRKRGCTRSKYFE
jgi:hypothetical protein